MRKLRNLFTLLVVSICVVQSAWAQEEQTAEQTIIVTLKESGGLASEIFAAQDVAGYDQSLTTVVNLKITEGELNATDWATLQSMDALKTLDLSGTSNKEIPQYQFDGKCNNLESISLPSQLETIGREAFRGKSKLVTAILPATLKSVGKLAFYGCSILENVGTTWPSGATTIPESCFDNCSSLNSFTIPSGVTIIEREAFSGCSNFSSTLPSTLTSIGYQAFWDAAMQDIDIILPEGIDLGGRVFSGSGIRSIIFPSSIGYLDDSRVSWCSNLKDITYRSGNVIRYNNNAFSLPNNEGMTIHVPDYLVDSYKSESFFHNFTIVGFDITNYDIWWQVDYPLNLNAYTRMAGEPKVSLKNDINLTISGEPNQKFGDLIVFGHTSRDNDGNNYQENWAQILSTCDNVTVTGEYMQKIQTRSNVWYFICLPFDVNISAIETENDAKYAIRYYDGASRAKYNSAEGNWKNCIENIPAGTGFIYQTSQTTWTTFKAVNNDNRNNVFKNEQIIITLAANATPDDGITLDAANKGWNLVGNPWQCYYNIHKLNYNAPICTYNNRYSTYTAYSIQDDDIALEPNQAFFVQCPDAVSIIGFPTAGRQLTAEVVSQSSRQFSPTEKSRWLVDVQIANGEEKDKTRLVVNNDASMDYEIGCDASKFMSWDGTVPQIYSLDADETQYAINERPFEKGTLRLGMVIKEDGQYTISAIRNDVGQVLLVDHETGLTTDLSQNGYCFNAGAGTYDDRFTLSFINNELTGIKTIDNTTMANDRYFNLSGQRVDQPKKGIYVVNGKKTVVK